MRISINAHLLSPESGYRRAGIHQYIAKVLNHLPQLDEHTQYDVYTRDSESIRRRGGLTIVSSKWPTEKRSMRILWEQSVWPIEAARKGAHLLHGMAFVLPAVGNIPGIVTVYDLSFVHFPEAFPALQRFYLHSQTARSVRQARRVITISDASRSDLHRFFDVPLEKIDVVLPGVEEAYHQLPEQEIAAFRRREGIERDFLLHVGTLQPRKNIPTLLQALANSQVNDLDLVLAGAKGWQYSDIFKQVERLGLVDRVHFTGYVADEVLPFWYNAARALVFPSIYEGFGMPVVEAMACGTPVIAAHSSSIPEAGGEAALYFDPQDVDRLAQHINDLSNDTSLRIGMQRAGLAQANTFSWQRAGIETAQVYAKALAEQ